MDVRDNGARSGFFRRKNHGCGILLVLLLASAAHAASPPLGFRAETVELRGEVLDSDVLEGAGDVPRALLVFTVVRTESGPDRHCTLYGLPGFEILAEKRVPERAVAFDTGDVTPAPGDEIVYLTPTGIRIQPRGKEGFAGELVPIEARTFFEEPEADALPRVALIHDLSGDGRADLLVPQPFGYLAALAPADPAQRLFSLSLASRNRMIRMTHEVIQTDFLAQSFALPVLLPGDFDGDGKPDLMGLDRKEFLVFLGKGAEGFSPRPSYRAVLPFLDVDVEEPEEDMFEGRRVFVEEIDGDGLADLVAVRTQGKVGLFSSIRTRFEVFLGRRDAFFPTFPDRLLTVPGVVTLPEFTDLDGDGKRDLVAPALRTDILSGIKTAALKEVTVTWHVFPAGPDGLWVEEPVFSQSESLPVGGIEKGEAVPAAAFHGDFDGDGMRDRLSLEDGRVRIHTAIPGLRFRYLEDPRWEVAAELSNDFEVKDLNGDGCSDLLFFHKDKIVVVLSYR